MTIDSYSLIRYDEPAGIDLRPAGNYRKRKRRRIDHIVLHWGGTSAFGLERALYRRGLSTHYGVHGSDVFHFLPHTYRAWHAGWANARSIGVDFCQQPTVDGGRASNLRSGRWEVEEIDNPTNRGDDRIVTLNARAVAAAREWLPKLCVELGVPFQVPRMAGGEFNHDVIGKRGLRKFRGIVGHHHVKATKWDIACWWSQLFD